MTKSFSNTEYASGLRALADFYEAHPDMPLPHPGHCVFTSERNEFLLAVKALAEGGMVQKVADEDSSTWPRYHAIRMFGPVKLDVEIDRKTICRMIRPAQPAVFECPDSLLEEAAEYLEGK